ncbi:LOW QUALITY PROTEIN: cytolytic toxin-beta-like [Aplochiton taeniatus]
MKTACVTLWDPEKLITDTSEKLQPNSSVEILASDSVEDKSSALNVGASLKASFLCGLVQVEGSAKYLSNNKVSKHQARAQVQSYYKVQLTMKQLVRGNVTYPYVFDERNATHVVTGILYGAQAFFVFERDVSEKEEHQSVEGDLKLEINKIPTFKIEGQGSLDMKEKDACKPDTFSCNFHGDFCLPNNPTLAKKLPIIRGGGEEESVLAETCSVLCDSGIPGTTHPLAKICV